MFDACHQLLGVFADRDAVGGHTVEVQRALRAIGLRSEIYACTGARPLEELPPDDGRTLLLYQASALSPAAEVALARTEPLVLNYHNVTPSTFFADWEPAIARELLAARHQIARLARRAIVGIADSAYNATELEQMGCPDVRVVPVLIDLDRVRGDRGEGVTGGARWLFVGRLCPNKAQHDVVKSFALYRRAFDPDATLTLVGRSSSHRYETALHELVASLGLGDAVQLVGSVTEDELAAAYRAADVFVCLSAHEGFCNTVVEAMAAGTPVVAFAAAALPETVASGGVLLADKDPWRVAATVHRIVADGALRRWLVGRGHARVDELDIGVARTRLSSVLGELVAA